MIIGQLECDSGDKKTAIWGVVAFEMVIIGKRGGTVLWASGGEGGEEFGDVVEVVSAVVVEVGGWISGAEGVDVG